MLKSTVRRAGVQERVDEQDRDEQQTGRRQIRQVAAEDAGPDDQRERDGEHDQRRGPATNAERDQRDGERDDQLGRRVEAPIRTLLSASYEIGQPSRSPRRLQLPACRDYRSSSSIRRDGFRRSRFRAGRGRVNERSPSGKRAR